MKSLTTKLALLITVLMLSFTATAQITDSQKAAVDGLFKDYTNSTPGAAVGVIRDGKLIYSNGYGMADLEHDVPITPESVFYMASVSKQFVTFAILLLEEEGKLGLDDEIQKHLPDFPRYKDPLTIRHFIHHTSGVRDSLTLWSLTGRDILDYIPKDAMYGLLKRQKELNFKPGEQYLYSNACYFMLALIVEKASGKSIREFAEEKMFKPLGMKNTHFHDDVNHIVKNRVFSYAPSKDGYRNLIMRFDLVGSGGLYSNIEDMLLWDQNFYYNKLGKGRQELIDKMLTDGLLNDGKSAGYAFGISNGTYKGLRTLSHGGALAGYRTYYLAFPEQKFSVVVLANIGNFNPGGKAEAVADVFLKDKFVAATPTGVEADAEKPSELPEVKITVAEMESVAGSYFSKDIGITVKLWVEDGALKFERPGASPVPLKPIGGNKFEVVDPNIRMALSFSVAGGKASKLDASITGAGSFEFVPIEPANYTPAALAKFAGTYYSDEIATFYHLRMEKDELTLFINDRRSGVLKPLSKVLFMNDELGAFEFGEDGGFTVEAGRVRGLRFVKRD